MTQPARCPECRKWIREKRAETATKNRFQDSSSGPKFTTAIVAWVMCEGWWTEARNADETRKWDASTRSEATRMSSRHSSGAPVDRIRIIGARFLVSSGIRWHPRIPRQTQSSRARTNGKIGSRYPAGEKWKTKRFQFVINLYAVAVAMVFGIVPEMAAANKSNRLCDFMDSWTTWYTCSVTLHRTGHAKQSSNCNAMPIWRR